MIEAPVALGFTAGMVAAFNPCGFAMLPAYISWFLGDGSGPDRDGPAAGALRALAVAGAVTLGFLAVFSAAGLVIAHLFTNLSRYTPHLAVAVGVGVLIPLGVARLAGREVKWGLPVHARGARGRGLGSMVLFGVSYALVSLSCTIAPFLVAVSGTFARADVVSGLAVFAAYAAGMGVVLTALTLALGLAQEGMVRRLRGVLPHVGRISGLLLVAAGAYVTYYGWYALALTEGRDVRAGPVAWVERASDGVADWFAAVGETRLGWAFAAFIVLTVTALTVRRRRRRRDRALSRI